jgi:hypothetical protein
MAAASVFTRAFCHEADKSDDGPRRVRRPLSQLLQARPSQRLPRVSWFIVKRGQLEYSGRISRQPFTAWCATNAGRKAIARVGAGLRFKFFRRVRRAQRRLWRNLQDVSRTDAFTKAMAAEPERYLQTLAGACYAEALPRAHVAIHRLVLAPRAFVAGRAKADVFTRLLPSPALAGLDDDVRKFVLDQIVNEMDAAVRRASPSAKRPVAARDGWVCVGARLGTVWLDPMWAGPDGTGHLFMYELPRQGLTRRDCKALETAMEQMSGAAASLSRNARDALLRSAASLHRA